MEDSKNQSSEKEGVLPIWSSVMYGNESKPYNMDEFKGLSDLDIDKRLIRPVIVTFYSYKGGVGRSTALAHTALALKEEYNVLCIDFDVEAPALHYLFNIDKKSLKPDKGLLPLLIEIESDSENIDIQEHLISLESNLSVIPSGEINWDYLKALRWIDYEMWYSTENNPIKKMLSFLDNEKLGIDIILIDARTGLSNSNPHLLFDISDMVIFCAYPSEQSKDINRDIVNALNSRPNMHNMKTETRFIFSPLVETEPNFIEQKERAEGWLQDWLPKKVSQNAEIDESTEIEELVEFIRYDKNIAIQDSYLKPNENYKKISEWVVSILPNNKQSIENDLKIKESKNLKPLKELKDITESIGVADNENEKVFHKFFIENNIYRDVLKEKRLSIIVGRKGTGKTALFRRLVEKDGFSPLCCPVKLQGKGFYKKTTSLKDEYSEWEEKYAKEEKVDWDLFWCIRTIKIIKPSYKYIDKKSSYLELQKIDENNKAIKIAIDGLDDWFSSTEEKKRKEIIEGLMSFWYNNIQNKNNFIFKIFIRQDLWGGINFTNRSHVGYNTKKIEIKKEDSLGMVLNVIRQSKEFQELQIQYFGKGISDWDFIFGERMDKGKNAYTINWIYLRLADANKEYNVRYFKILISLAVKIEYEDALQKNGEYEKPPIIKPKHLKSALRELSEQALSSFKEEYGEPLENMFKALQRIQKSPFGKEDMEGIEQDQISLAKELGLIAERKDGRFSIPELYRYGLGIKRQGKE